MNKILSVENIKSIRDRLREIKLTNFRNKNNGLFTLVD